MKLEAGVDVVGIIAVRSVDDVTVEYEKLHSDVFQRRRAKRRQEPGNITDEGFVIKPESDG